MKDDCQMTAAVELKRRWRDRPLYAYIVIVIVICSLDNLKRIYNVREALIKLYYTL